MSPYISKTMDTFKLHLLSSIYPEKISPPEVCVEDGCYAYAHCDHSFIKSIYEQDLVMSSPEANELISLDRKGRPVEDFLNSMGLYMNYELSKPQCLQVYKMSFKLRTKASYTLTIASHTYGRLFIYTLTIYVFFFKV